MCIRTPTIGWSICRLMNDWDTVCEALQLPPGSGLGAVLERLEILQNSVVVSISARTAMIGDKDKLLEAMALISEVVLAPRSASTGY